MAWCRRSDSWKNYSLWAPRGGVVCSHIVILKLGTDDLSHLDPLVAASAIEDLVGILYETKSTVCDKFVFAKRQFAKMMLPV